MRLKLIFPFLFLLHFSLFAQENNKYAADWASLDTRPTPEWWKDAKFGVYAKRQIRRVVPKFTYGK
jgi:alpha-L-fucosidase